MFFYPVKELKGQKLEHNGSFVLAEGETTGHKHTIVSPSMEIRQTEDGRYYFSTDSPAEVSHEEHKTITLEPGIYRVDRIREKDWFSGAVRRIID